MKVGEAAQQRVDSLSIDHAGRARDGEARRRRVAGLALRRVQGAEVEAVANDVDPLGSRVASVLQDLLDDAGIDDDGVGHGLVGEASVRSQASHDAQPGERRNPAAPPGESGGDDVRGLGRNQDGNPEAANEARQAPDGIRIDGSHEGEPCLRQRDVAAHGLVPIRQVHAVRRRQSGHGHRDPLLVATPGASRVQEEQVHEERGDGTKRAAGVR